MSHMTTYVERRVENREVEGLVGLSIVVLKSDDCVISRIDETITFDTLDAALSWVGPEKKSRLLRLVNAYGCLPVIPRY